MNHIKMINLNFNWSHVYRLGYQVFNLERGVRFPLGLPHNSPLYNPKFVDGEIDCHKSSFNATIQLILTITLCPSLASRIYPKE